MSYNFHTWAISLKGLRWRRHLQFQQKPFPCSQILPSVQIASIKSVTTLHPKVMDGKAIQDFINQIWIFVTDKHTQGGYNTVCLVVLLTLPLLVFLTAVVVCCHCCCCRHANSCCCCCCRDGTTTSRSETKKKKNSSNNEDLWISVKPMTPDSVTLTML